MKQNIRVRMSMRDAAQKKAQNNEISPQNATSREMWQAVIDYVFNLWEKRFCEQEKEKFHVSANVLLYICLECDENNSLYQELTQQERRFVQSVGKGQRGMFSAKIFFEIWEKEKISYLPDTDFYHAILETDTFEISTDIASLCPSHCFWVDMSIFGTELIGISLLYLWEHIFVSTYYKHGGGGQISFPVDSSTAVTSENISHALEGEQDNREHFMFALQLFSYLYSHNPDVAETRYSQNRHRRDIRLNNENGSVREFEVGRRIGSAIRAYNAGKQDTDAFMHYDDENGSPGQGKTRTSPIPHIRRAHWSHVWVGKRGNQILKPVWIAPSYINCQPFTDLPETVHMIASQRKGYKGEQMISDNLTGRNIVFQPQYYVKQTGKYYDFALLCDGLQMIIEFDGEQHFRPVKQFGGFGTYKKQVTTDREKTLWCRQHGIPLLRIRFDQILSINEMIDDLLINPEKYRKQVNSYLTDSEYYAICFPFETS